MALTFSILAVGRKSPALKVHHFQYKIHHFQCKIHRLSGVVPGVVARPGLDEQLLQDKSIAAGGAAVDNLGRLGTVSRRQRRKELLPVITRNLRNSLGVTLWWGSLRVLAGWRGLPPAWLSTYQCRCRARLLSRGAP